MQLEKRIRARQARLSPPNAQDVYALEKYTTMTAQKDANYLSVQERVELGKAARTRCSRSDHAAWAPASDRPDPVDLLEAQAKTRDAELVPIRYGRMLASPFAFYRGAAVIMASDLAAAPNTGLHVQLCGDAHLSNFGGFASPERELVLDVNDFDETLPGPWEWDVKRLAASIEIVGRELNYSAKVRRGLVLGAVGEYHRAMSDFAAMGNLEVWSMHLDPAGMRERWGAAAKPKAIKTLDADFAPAHSRDNFRAFEKLTERVAGRVRIAPGLPWSFRSKTLRRINSPINSMKRCVVYFTATSAACNLTVVVCSKPFSTCTWRARSSAWAA